ncbi:metallophosphoesterase family protein, partial [Halolamina salina]
RIAATHRQRGGATGLAMFGRERGADLVVSGHTHRPLVDQEGAVTLLNPGSHADPRGAKQSFAVLEPNGDGLNGRLTTVDGETFDRFTVENG